MARLQFHSDRIYTINRIVSIQLNLVELCNPIDDWMTFPYSDRTYTINRMVFILLIM